MPYEVVIVDDDVVTGKVLRFLLEDEGYRTSVLRRGSGAVEQVTNQETDLVLLDLNVPDVDAFTLTRLLRARRYTGLIVLLSERHSVTDEIEGINVGADDYVAKPDEPRELLERVENIIQRAKPDDQQLDSVVQVEDAELSLGELTFRSAVTPSVRLTPTEMRMLEVLMRNCWTVVSRDTLAERVWGYDIVGNTNRVDVYVRRVRRKIEPNPREPRYLHTVRGAGYVFRAGTR